MIRSITSFVTSACMAGVFAGCTNMTMLRTRELRAVQASVDSLRTELREIGKAADSEQKNQSEMLRLMRADQQLRFGELDRKVSQIESNLDENHFRLSKIGEQTSEFQKKMEARLAADSIAETTRNAEIDKLLQIATGDFSAGRYDIAINGFKDLVNRFPESPQAAEAEYWIAESYYAKKVLFEAERNYLSYVKKYPQGSRLCVSLYKLGLVYEKSGKGKSKTMVWRKALEQCPDSPELSVIRAQLR